MFQLKRKTPHGEIKIKLFREMTLGEMIELNSLLFKWTEPRADKSATVDASNKSGVVNLETSIRDSLRGERKLGSNPKTEIKMGEYVEPTYGGVNIQMLDYPDPVHKMSDLINQLRVHAPISLMGWMDILRGNYNSVKFTPEVAEKILAVLKQCVVYATIVVPDAENAEAAGR